MWAIIGRMACYGDGWGVKRLLSGECCVRFQHLPPHYVVVKVLRVE